VTRLLWDKIGERLYEDGLDRGVLYLPDDNGVAWNGLTSVEEDMGEDTSDPVYFDGVKYMDDPSIGDFSATLNAFTYPDEFLEYEGIEAIGGGMFVDGQDSNLFGLCYRTKVGNDTEGTDLGYKLHLLYNLTAVPDASNYQTISETASPLEFSWKITGVPVSISGYRATCHVILDSRFLRADVLAALEDILYGTTVYGWITYDGGTPGFSGPGLVDGGLVDSTSFDLPGYGIVSSTIPRLPTIDELIDLVTLWDPKVITAHPLSGLNELVDGMGDMTQVKVPGIFVALPGTRLSPTGHDGYYVLS
jgi:hypothetical protein